MTSLQLKASAVPRNRRSKMSSPVKSSVYLPEAMYRAIQDQAIRLNCSRSKILQTAWVIAQEEISKRPEFPPIDGPAIIAKKEEPK
jgi:uncharacterized small protein (TIGR04563 family)